jgi:S-adenosylmethionine:diacylglycerol 3-amino-3-carboxypropyl transferase
VIEPLYFAQIREDAEIERAIVAAAGAARIVTVGSGGCTALSLLTDRVTSVAAVDSSPAQCALIELRRAALAELSRTEHLAFVGETVGGHRLAVYEQRLRGALPRFVRDYWDQRPDAIDGGINLSGVTERFYRFLGENLRRSVVAEDVWRSLFDPTLDLGAQADLVARHFDTDAFRMAVRVLLSKTTHLEFFPTAMFLQVSEHHFGDYFLERFRDALLRRPQSDNYFLHQVLFGHYMLDRPRGVPHYLSASGYAEAKRNVQKLHVHAASLQDLLPAERGLDAAFLSNVFDWAPPPEREVIAERAVASLRRGGALLYRCMLADPPLPEAVRRSMSIDERWGRELCAAERALLYRRVVVATRPR